MGRLLIWPNVRTDAPTVADLLAYEEVVQLLPTHGARVHLNALSADGGDFFHTHMEGTPSNATVIEATLRFLRIHAGPRTLDWPCPCLR